MIDIPPGSTSSAASSGTATVSSAADMARAAVVAKLDAVVQAVQARADSGQAEKPAWDILLKLNPASTAPPLPTDKITPDILRQLQAGQAVLLQTRAEILVPAGSRLQVDVSLAQGVQIRNLQLPNPLPAQQLTQLKQWIPRQQPVQPLLANLLHLLQQDQRPQLAALPLRVQVAIQQLVAALADPAQVRNPGHFQALLRNSGLFFEGKLAQAIAQPGAATTSAVRLQPTGQPQPGAQAPATAAGNDAKHPALHNMTRHMRDWVAQFKPAAAGNLAPAPSNAAAAQGPTAHAASAALPLRDVMQGDLKQALQQLEKNLNAATPSPAETAGGKPAAPATAGTATTGTAASAAPLASGETADNATRKADATLDPTRKPDGTRAADAAPAAAATRSPLAIQRYQAAGPPGSAHTAFDPGAVPDLIPPLPGQIVVQAQARSRASLKTDDMADAIVKTLLAQVRGALARVTLHQLSSHTARQDSAAPTTLSFEIPFLHHQQVEMFQFRIEEEKESAQDKSDRKQGKRWVVQMGFDIEGLGPMFCQLSMSGQSMAVQFWAAWEQTLNSTKAHFGFLENVLQEMGIRVEKIQAQLGMPELDKTGVRNQLVDIKT